MIQHKLVITGTYSCCHRENEAIFENLILGNVVEFVKQNNGKVHGLTYHHRCSFWIQEMCELWMKISFFPIL